MAGWFFDRVMDKLFNVGFDYLQDQYFRGRTGMKEELKRLRVNHPMIQALVSAYTQGKIADRNLNCWLWQLRDAIDEADDVLDDLEYMKLEEQLEQNMEETKVRSSFNRFFLGPARKLRKVCGRAFKIDPNLERLEEAVQKLDRVSAQVNTFLHLVEKKEKEQQVKDQQLCDDRASGSFPGPVFIGRDQDKEIVMQWLRKPSDHNLSLLSVVGHGGMGKTTLLQNIFADEITKQFDLKIWVCVSHNFEVEKLITDMLKYLDKWSSHLTILPPLQERLNSVTRSKKFLLVLDDIWEENTTKWEKVISPLANGKLGSKILVTTRIHAAASMIPDMIIENKEALTLKGLEEAQCLELLKTHAFGAMENFSSEHKKLMCIAEEIVKKLSGSPLATKVIGGVLKYDLTPEHWERVLKLNLSNLRHVEILKVLHVSNLSNLRHVDLPSDVFSSVPGIGKLRSLQKLNEFYVKNENGYRIGELEHLSELHKLKIDFLENVKDAGEAHTAKLFEKRKLKDLFLNWGKAVGGREIESPRNIINSELDVNVLENLKPYKNLKKLSIVSCKGLSCAKWMYDVDLISNLEYISLNGGSEWETLPPFGQLPHLKLLYLCNMPKAKRLDYKFHGNDKVSVFPSLEVLNMEGLQVLVDWFDGEGVAAYDCFFPCLTELILDNCPNLQELPYLPPKPKSTVDEAL